MINSSKLLSRTSKQGLSSRRVLVDLTIVKRDAVRIDSLLKERLVLTKVREGIMRQKREDDMRVERERQLEEKREDDSANVDPEKKKNPKSILGNIIKFVLGGFLNIIGKITFGILPRLPFLLKTIVRFTRFFGTIIRGTFNIASTLIKVAPKFISKFGKFTGKILTQIIGVITRSLVPAATTFVGRIAGLLSAPFAGAGTRAAITRATRPAGGFTEDYSDAPSVTQEGKTVGQLKNKGEKLKEIKARRKLQKEKVLKTQTDFGQIEKGRKIKKRMVRLEKRQFAKIAKLEAQERLGLSAADESFFNRLELDPALGKRGADPREIAKQKKLLRKRMSPSFDKNLTERVLREAEVDGSLRTRVQLENAMNPLRTRKPGEDVLGNLFKRVDDPKQIMLDQPLMKAPKIPKVKASKLVGKKGLSKVLFNFGGEALEQSVKQSIKASIGVVPIIGDLIGVLLDVFLFGEPVGRALFKGIGSLALGALIGGVGTFLGGPIGTLIGSIIGGIGGDILGGIAYDLFFGRKAQAGGYSTVTGGGKEYLKGVSKARAVQKFDEGGVVRNYEPPKQVSTDRSSDLRSLAFYEKNQVGREVMVPIPIPIPSSKNQGQGSRIVINKTSGEKSAFSQHYRRG